jgi:hypothetical protein
MPGKSLLLLNILIFEQLLLLLLNSCVQDAAAAVALCFGFGCAVFRAVAAVDAGC